MELVIGDYAQEIQLYEEYNPKYLPLSGYEKAGIINSLLKELHPVTKQLGEIEPNTIDEKRQLLHATLNILKPGTLKGKSVELLNYLLQCELRDKELVRAENIPIKNKIKGTNLSIYQGDITTLEVDAIVNAANSQLLGCFQPLHGCIDNAIHSKAGIQLRDDCQIIVKKQKTLEATGKAKITRAYNLPSKFVIHTVGPIVQGKLNAKHKEDLRQSYSHCLDLCKEVSAIKSIAFCCISTGVFGYPPKEAAKTAYKAVCKWLNQNPNHLEKVIFNVFTNNDLKIYNSLIE